MFTERTLRRNVDVSWTFNERLDERPTDVDWITFWTLEGRKLIVRSDVQDKVIWTFVFPVGKSKLERLIVSSE